MAVSYAVARIGLTGGVTITPPGNGMTLFTGPSKWGRSRWVSPVAVPRRSGLIPALRAICSAWPYRVAIGPLAASGRRGVTGRPSAT